MVQFGLSLVIYLAICYSAEKISLAEPIIGSFAHLRQGKHK